MARKRRLPLAAPESLGAVLDRAGENRGAKHPLPVPVGAWIEAVGPRIAERAFPERLERGVLFIRVASSSWAQELSMLSSEILGRLSRHGVRVEFLRFRVGEVPTHWNARQIIAPVKLQVPAELPPDLEQAIEAVEDESLRRAIEDAARANLAWQKERDLAPQGTPQGARLPKGGPGGTKT